MNLLAHAFLAGDDREALLGNLLADFIKGSDRAGLSPGLLRGMAQHQAIDAFTDSHPVTHRCRARIEAPYRRYGGILVDIFYDHFLSREWANYSPLALPDFTRRVYACIEEQAGALPPPTPDIIGFMKDQDLLASYADLPGVELALTRVARRLSKRLGKTVEMAGGVGELERSYEAFAEDFREFFPQLQGHMREWQPASAQHL